MPRTRTGRRGPHSPVEASADDLVWTYDGLMKARRTIEGERRLEILRATAGVLAQRGYERLTFDEIAATAHVSKPTLYRHWGSKLDLVIESLKDQARRQPSRDRGSLRADLIAAVLDPDSVFRDVSFDAFCAMFSEILRDREAADRFLGTFVDDGLGFGDIWSRAIDRGEVESGADIDLLNAGLVYGLVHLIGLRGQPMSIETVERVIDTLVIPSTARFSRNTQARE